MTEKQDTSFKAYLKAIGHGITHIKLSKYDKQVLRFMGFLVLLMVAMISPFLLLLGLGFRGNLGALLGTMIWGLSWFCCFYIPWREKWRGC